jgi:death-on-curing protein
VESPIFGVDRFPSVYEKASAYAFYIIADHIFHDGNKRTGMETALLFLRSNGLAFTPELASNVIVSLALGIATGRAQMPEIAEWIRRYTRDG